MKDDSEFIKENQIFSTLIEVPNINTSNGAFVFTFTDITETKKNEAKIKENLREKDLLIKEIHHRVKNNLQVISSLLKLQMKSVFDDHSRDILKDSQNRIQTMALIHKNLYRSENLMKIDFTDYTTELTKNLLASYRVSNRAIKLNIQVENVELSIDSAIPCGIIINELFSNSIKHAFKDSEVGEISIKFIKNKNLYEFEFSDNGCGIPIEILENKNPNSLGMTLIKELASQLQSTMSLTSNSEGTSFKMTFKGNIYEVTD